MADDEADALDNWEEQADSGLLDKRLEEMAIDIQSQSKETKKQALAPGASEVLPVEDTVRTQYQPQVRILRREPKTSSAAPHNNSNSPSSATNVSKTSKHSKSLQQREAEYSQARLRIFGSLPPEDDDGDNDATDNTVKVEDNSIRSQSSPQIMKPDPTAAHMSILRQPKGPDGTNGFKKPDPP